MLFYLCTLKILLFVFLLIVRQKAAKMVVVQKFPFDRVYARKSMHLRWPQRLRQANRTSRVKYLNSFFLF